MKNILNRTKSLWLFFKIKKMILIPRSFNLYSDVIITFLTTHPYITKSGVLLYYGGSLCKY